MTASARFWIGAAAVAVVGCAAMLALPRAFGLGWLAATFLWSGLAIGSIGYLLMMRLIGGAWRDALQPALERGAASLPIAIASTVPLIVGMAKLYPWVDAPEPGFRGLWLTPLGFGLRSALLFALLFAVLRWRSTVAAIIGLIGIALPGSLVATDWAMSLDPSFHSSDFGLQALGMAFTLALAVAIIRAPGRAGGVPGALLLTLLMFWCYFDYLQFFILWSGNMPDSARWYLVRGASGWVEVEFVAVALHAGPLLALLSPAIRRSNRWLPVLAIAVIAGEMLHAGWLVLPAADPPSLVSVCAGLAAFLIIGAASLRLGKAA